MGEQEVVDTTHITSRYPMAYVVPFSFAFVDATIEDINNRQKKPQPWKTRRVGLSSASARYDLQIGAQSGSTARLSFYVRIINEQATLIGGFFPDNPSPTPAKIRDLGGAVESLVSMIYAAHSDLYRFAEFYLNNPGSPIPFEGGEAYVRSLQQFAPTGKGGPSRIGQHVSWEEDDWAWEQVNTLGRPRPVVRAEWLQRLSPDRKVLKDPSDSFRKAVNINRKGKRKSER